MDIPTAPSANGADSDFGDAAAHAVAQLRAALAAAEALIAADPPRTEGAAARRRQEAATAARRLLSSLAGLRGVLT